MGKYTYLLSCGSIKYMLLVGSFSGIFPKIELHCFYFCIGKHLIVHHVCENASSVAENVHFYGFAMMNTV